MDESNIQHLAIAGLCLFSAVVYKWVTNALTSNATKVSIAVGGKIAPGLMTVMLGHALLWVVAIWHIGAFFWSYI